MPHFFIFFIFFAGIPLPPAALTVCLPVLLLLGVREHGLFFGVPFRRHHVPAAATRLVVCPYSNSIGVPCFRMPKRSLRLTYKIKK